MEIALYILLALAALVVILVVIVALQPSDYRIARSATMAAPSADVFAQVNDFHKWEAWSPWAKLDPAMKLTYEGAPAGVGAIYSWNGNNEVGEGRMTILESKPNELIGIQLEFMRPFADTSTAEFTFKPEGDKTIVTWAIIGRRKFMLKAICMFMNMDKMLGGEFEKGFASMKAIVEAKK